MTEQLTIAAQKVEIANQKVEIANLKREIYWLRLVLKNISNVVNNGLESTTDLTFEDTKEEFLRQEGYIPE